MTGIALMQQPLLPSFAALCLGMIATGVWLLHFVARLEMMQQRIDTVRQRAGIAGSTQSSGQGGLLTIVASLGTLMSRSGLLPAATLAELEGTLASAGMRQHRALALFIGGKLLLLLLPPLAYLLLRGASLAPMVRMLAISAAGVVGLLLPDMIIRRFRASYLKAVAFGLPDALDMLVICSEAGLGLETGLDRVATEIAPAHPAVAAELKITSAELRVLADRRTALTNMGTRTGLDTLKRLGATLIQTMRYGTPLSQALRTLAAEMRFEMLMRFEAQAARLPVLLTVPMILFILPCIFIVVGGPAGLTVVRTFVRH